ncbi:MAG TPA: phosphatidylglycerol lysyltransferase domain-containing protein [Acidimicrobiales bacterium]
MTTSDRVPTDIVPDAAAVDVALGTRVLVVGDLRLSWRPTAGSLAVAAEIGSALDAWAGPGVLVLNGDTFDFSDDTQRDPGRILDAHPRLATALHRFAADDARRVVILSGQRDADLADPGTKARSVLTERFGVDVGPAVDLHIATGAGDRVVHVEHGSRFDGGGVFVDAAPASVELSRAAYRRISRLLAWLVLPFTIALLCLVGFGLLDTFHPSGAHRLLGWSGQLAVLSTAAVAILVIGVVLRRTFRALPDSREVGLSCASNDDARAYAERLVGDGGTGLVTGYTHRPELSSLGRGFYANSGSCGTIVRPRRARLGLPALFVAERQLSWVELEAGADLHARLVYALVDIPGQSLLERLAAVPGPEPVTKPTVVAAFPGGTDWPVPVFEDLGRRRVRRQAGAVLALTGLLNLLSAITPPIGGRLDFVADFVPITVPETASALVAAAGIALLLLGRGVRRGQRHAWMLAVGLTGLSAALHIVKGLDVEEAVAALMVLGFLIAKRGAFTAVADRPSIGRGFAVLGVSGALAVAAGTFTAVWFGKNHMPTGRALTAVVERLVGDNDILIPGRRGRFLTPTLGGVGLALALTAVWLLFRPVVARHKPADLATRARAIVRRYGGDTLAYFALRDDKQHWFWRDTLIAYAVHNGVCLVSPDPIGPVSERNAAWRAFREFAEDHGWPVAVMGAGEAWLPIYRAAGMHDLYVGDEAIVDARRFNLEGGRMKGLRQAVNRIAKYGYRIEFHDPAHLDPELERELRTLMTGSRRGEVERGFSMTLGRVFNRDDTGLLLAVCFAPSGEAAAFCQYVPASDINGFSLDLMRRSEASEHWNGLTDFVVVRTIEHVRDLGMHGLGLNFAVMRSVLAHEGGDRIGHRIERRLLGWLSDSMQIESLWKYNAKFDPDWHPRYAVYDARENFLSSAVAVAKAESFWELPVVGRFFAPDDQPVRS